jgi:Domain of Unknown Function (DUF1080)
MRIMPEHNALSVGAFDMANSIKIILAIFLFAGCARLGKHETGMLLIHAGQGLEHFTRVGDADWTIRDGNIEAGPDNKAMSFLVSKNKYRDFHARIEFWASADANSGVFLRCQNPTEITAENCYEANIFDQRPEPSYGTGAIVLIAKVAQPMPKAGGRWNTYEITAKGDRLVLMLNGITTVDVRDGKLAEGHLALQWGSGTIKFRTLEIRPL